MEVQLMLTGLKKFTALLLVLTIVFSQVIISAPAESPASSSSQDSADMNDSNNTKTAAANADYANFRNVKAGRIGQFVLFRSQHPANGSSRSVHANALAKMNAIAAVLNLSDSDKKLKSNFTTHKIAPTHYYRSLYEKGNVHLANMKGAYNETAYRTKIVACMRFMIRKQGPYLVHCEIGRDRTGFVILLLESLMGASYTYMFKDYAQSYISRDGLTYEQARKKSIPLINEIMHRITGKPKNTGWGKLNLTYYAELYLKKGGMSPAEINTLKRNLMMNCPQYGSYYDLVYVPREADNPEYVPAEPTPYDQASEVSEFSKAENETDNGNDNGGETGGETGGGTGGETGGETGGGTGGGTGGDDGGETGGGTGGKTGDKTGNKN